MPGWVEIMPAILHIFCRGVGAASPRQLQGCFVTVYFSVYYK